MSEHDEEPREHHEPAAPERPPSTTWADDIVPATVPPEPEAPEGEAKKKEQRSFFKELPILILIAFGLAMLIKTFFVQAFYIPSESMVPTLDVGDRVLVNKIVYKIRDPRRGEIVVFVGERDDEPRSFIRRVLDSITEGLGSPSGAERDFIKRVIGLPGETVQVTEQGDVLITTVDGERRRLDEPYLASRDPEEDSSFGPVEVPEGHFFVMGDNRGNSADSRSTLGPVADGDIIGKAFVRIWPPGRFAFFRTPSYEEAAAAAAILPLAAFALVGGYRRRRGRRDPDGARGA